MKVKFGFGKSRWWWDVKQIFVTPCVGIVILKKFPDDYTEENSVIINISWLIWGAYVDISRTVRIEEEQQ